MSDVNQPKQLKRELGLFGAILIGLASMVGAGIFVSLGIATGISGSSVILALALAGFLAACNGLNIAQLGANHPFSGGVYEYGYRYLTPWLGFIGGWTYLLAKTAVAASAALGFAGYFLKLTGLPEKGLVVAIAEIVIFIFTLVVLGGMRRSKVTTIVIVSVAISSLLFLVIAGSVVLPANGLQRLSISITNPGEWSHHVLEATALMFVAYTGYGRIATLGEEVVEPLKNIPRAIIFTTILTIVLYIAVAIVSLASIGAEAFSDAARLQAAPLEVVAESFGIPGAAQILAIGAITAMLGVVLSAILGLSRIFLAMGRRGDMPSFVAKLNDAGTTPYWAVIIVGIAIALLVLIGDLKTTWSFSAFASLVRSFITNLAALQLSDGERLYPKWLTWFALLSCLFLVFWIEVQFWLIGLGFIAVGLVWHFAIHRYKLVVTKD
ncbi:MAG: APC family permease [Nostocaceae cyanobacterium]|nr:APC family permease [Nostocaceae cyanobacterium]